MQQLDLEPFRKTLTEWKMKTVIVLQRNSVALEWYDRGFDTVGPLYSCTKSVLSALIGIALDKGYLKSVDQPITDYLKPPPELRDALSRIHIRHLLTMTSGFHWPDFDKPYKAFKASDDPLRFVLERPLLSESGTAFSYNSGGSHLLSAILSAATGMTGLQFAKERLFSPLEFRNARWMNRSGVNEGGAGLHLYGRDLAKIGQLYAQNGRYNNERLISADWVEQSTKLHHRGLLHYEPPIYGGYGYHWWITPATQNGFADCYFAFGHGGQYLLVSPAHELVIVLRKQAMKRNDAMYSKRFMFEHLIPALFGAKQPDQ